MKSSSAQKLSAKKIEDMLLRLKAKVIDTAEFRETFNYFMDHFGENPAFLKLGKPVFEEPQLKAALERISRSIFPSGSHQVQLVLTYLEDHKFYHGAAMVNGHAAMVFYFEDLSFGMATITEMDGSLNHIRITVAAETK